MEVAGCLAEGCEGLESLVNVYDYRLAFLMRSRGAIPSPSRVQLSLDLECLCLRTTIWIERLKEKPGHCEKPTGSSASVIALRF